MFQTRPVASSTLVIISLLFFSLPTWASGRDVSTLAVVMMFAANAAHIAVAEDIYVDILISMSDARKTSASDCEGDALEWYQIQRGNQTVNGCIFVGGGEIALSACGALAVEHFNNRNGKYVAAFGELGNCDKKIVARLHDAGSSQSVTIRTVLDLMSRNNPPHVFIGPDSTSATIPTALISGVLDVPQLGYWSTGVSLNNVEEFPRYMRTIPSDNGVASAICKFWVSQKYRFAGMIYINDSYGESFKEAIVSFCKKEGMEHVFTFAFDSRGAAEEKLSIDSQIDSMARLSLNVFLLVSTNTAFKAIMESAYNHGISGPGTSWIVTDGVASFEFDALSGPARQAASGILRVVSAGGTTNREWESFRRDWPTFDTSMLSNYLPEFWDLDSTFFQDSDPGMLEVKDVGTFLYDTIATTGILACQIAETGPLPTDFGTRFWNLRETIDLPGLSGRVKFDETGDRDVSTASYIIENVLMSQDGTTRLSSAGMFNSSTNQWDFFFSPLIQCGESIAPVVDIRVPEHKKMTPSVGVKSFLWALFFVTFGFGVVILSQLIRFRDHSVIRFSQRRFLVLVNLGTIIGALVIPTFTIDDANLEESFYNYSDTSSIALPGTSSWANTGCRMSVFLYTISFCLTFTPLFGKLYRITKVLLDNSTKKTLTMKRPVLSNEMLTGLIAFSLLVDVGIVIAWQLTNPIIYVRVVTLRDHLGHPLESVGKCDSSGNYVFVGIIFTWHSLFLLYGSYLSWASRNITTTLSEGAYLGLALLTNFQLLSVALPVLNLVSDDRETWVFVISCVQFLMNFSVQFVVFVPKFFAINKGITQQSILAKIVPNQAQPISTTFMSSNTSGVR